LFRFIDQGTAKSVDVIFRNGFAFEPCLLRLNQGLVFAIHKKTERIFGALGRNDIACTV
jgi:hypothetical protein